MNPKQLIKGAEKAFTRRNVRLFTGCIPAAKAFKGDLEKMLQFLGDAAKNPKHHGMHRDHHHTLVTAVEKLEHLRSVVTTLGFCNNTR